MATENMDRIEAVIRERAAYVVKLPPDQRRANLDAYKAELIKGAGGREVEKAEQLANIINSMTLDLIAQMESSSGGGVGHA